MKITFQALTKFPIAAARTINVPATTFAAKEIDLAGVKWLDDPDAKTVTAQLRGWPAFLVMGGASKTPYDPAWGDPEIHAALQAQLGFKADAAGNGTPIAHTV